jgi:probable rRNA maturation factor
MSSDGPIVLFRRAPAELNRPGVERFAQTLRQEVAGGAAFRCLVTDDRELRRLNRTFLGKDYPTDVLSFPEPGPDRTLGEMAISGQRALDQASVYGHSVDDEVRILMLHGLLHLMGMDHEHDRGKMARAEARWRTRLRLPAGLIQRVRA